jgi:outer membrane lipoprotein-sorting protein
LKFVLIRTRQALAAGLLALTPALTGCLTHVRSVPKIRPATIVYEDTLDDLLQKVDKRYQAIQTFNASIELQATEGKGPQGKVIEHPTFSGYIFIRKPEDMRILLRVPLLGSQALNLVSDGKKWTLWIPPRSIAMTGTSDQPDASEHGLESLRPAVILDSLLIQGRNEDQIVSLTQDSRVLPDPKNKKDMIEEPDYELAILAQPKGKTERAIRVIHIGRSTLQPYQQDIYGPDGAIVTRAFYSEYQKFGEVSFPMKIKIDRPRDQYSLTITILKLTLNQAMENDQFEIKIPEGVPVKVMK